MHTKFTLTYPEVLDQGNIRRIEDYIKALPITEGFEFSVDVLAPKRTVKIIQDRDPINPREDDKVGMMFCRHGRYNLGDKDADDPYVTHGYVDLDGYKLYESGYDDVGDPPEDAVLYPFVLETLNEIRYELMNEYEEVSREIESDLSAEEAELLIETDLTTYPEVQAIQADIDRVTESIKWLQNLPYQTERVLRDDIAVCLPLYLYDHGGITISHGSFSCKWDSGQVGWHYITRDAVKQNWGDSPVSEADLQRVLDCELKEYDAYLQGYVWGFVVEDEDGDTVDSCWGFIGEDWEDVRHMMEYSDLPEDQWKKAWENRYD